MSSLYKRVLFGLPLVRHQFRTADQGHAVISAGTRCFSTEPRSEGFFGKVNAALTPRRLQTAAAGGAVIVVGLTTVLYEVGSSFLQLTPYTTGKFGFVVGAITAGGASIAFNRVISLMSLSPDTVKTRVLEYLRVNEYSQHAFGGEIVGGDFVGIRTGAGHVTVQNRSIVWSPTFVEIIIGVKGANNTVGVVTAVAVKSFRGANLTSVCVHMDGMQPKFIAGDEDSVIHHKKMANSITIKM